MTFWVAGAMVGSALIGSNASSSAANAQVSAADRSAELQKQMFERQVQLSEPWRKAGETALNKLIPLTEYTPFGPEQFKADPGYSFRLAEGQKALERSAAARGGLLSGATGKALTRFGQEAGSQEYTNAFNRYQTERAARLQPLQSLAGVGQTTAQQIGQAGSQMASNVGEAYQGAGNARASSYIGGANALSSALGQGLNYYQGQQLINRMYPYPSSGASYGPTYGEQPLGPEFAPYLK